MEIYQLKVFLEVARYLSFTEAAESLNLTQPAVSAKIKSLESELKSSLFNRLGKQIELTEVGHCLVDEGKKLVELEAKISDKIKNFRSQHCHNLVIGSSIGLAQNWLPKIIYQYRQQYPKIKIKLEVFEDNNKLYQSLSEGNIDLSFSEIEFSDRPDLDLRNINAIQYGLFVATDRPLAKTNWLSLADIKSMPLLLLSDRFASHQIFVSRLSELGLQLSDFPRLEIVDTIALMRTYLTQGNYLAFAADVELQAELDSKILFLITLQEFALKSDIYLSLFPQSDRDKQNSIDRFLALLPQIAESDSSCSPTLRSPPGMPAFQIEKRQSSQETITIDLGVQNSTIPTITAGLIVQRLGLLEHFLPRTGRYSQVKYDIRWHNFASGFPIVAGLHSKALNIGILGDYPLLQSAIQNDSDSFQPTCLVSFVSINPDGGGNAVIVPQASKLKSVEDLRGKAVALPFGSSAHGMLLRALSHLNLLSQVKLIPLKNSQIDAPFYDELAAGYAYFSPFHQLARDRGHFKYLFKGNLSQLPGFYGVVASQSFADRYPEIVVSYLKALMAARSWLDRTPSAFSLVSQWTKIKPEILTGVLTPTFSSEVASGFIPDCQIRRDWLESHIAQLQTIPDLQKLGKIKLDRWIQPEFLAMAGQN